jgi:hypothetical protein
MAGYVTHFKIGDREKTKAAAPEKLLSRIQETKPEAEKIWGSLDASGIKKTAIVVSPNKTSPGSADVFRPIGT